MEAQMTLIYFLITAILYLVVQAIFINGIKLASMGSTEILPDGTQRDSEMILYPMAKELMKKTTAAVHYSGDQLKNLYTQVILIHPLLNGATMELNGIRFADNAQRESFLQAEPLFFRNPYFLSEGIKFELDNTHIYFWREIDFYHYSKWVRKPVIQCIVCMASFWGLFTFLVPMLVIYHFAFWVFPAYVINAFLLGTVNKYIFKLVQ